MSEIVADDSTKIVHIMLTVRVDKNANVRKLITDIEEQLEVAGALTDGSAASWTAWVFPGKTEQVRI